MASRRQRQRKAAHNTGVSTATVMIDTERALAEVEKSGQSKQLRNTDGDAFADLYTSDKAVRPPIALEALLTLMETNSTHSGAINAKAADAVGRGWHLETEDDTEGGGDGATGGDTDTTDEPPAQPQDVKDPEVDKPVQPTGGVDDQARAERKLRDWLRDVCPMLKFPQLISQAYREYDGVGWAFIEVVREGTAVTSPISELLPVPPQTMRATKIPGVYVQQRGDQRVYFKEFGFAESVSARYGTKDAKSDDDEANEVIVFKQYSPRSDHYGVPYWISSAPDLAELAAIREYNISWFSSGGKVDRLVHVTDEDEANAKATANSITKKMAESARKSHGHVSVVTWGGEKSKVTVETLEPKSNDGTREGAFKAERKELRAQVLVAHQVPPYRVGFAEVGALAGNAAKEMLGAYRFGTIEPGQETFEEILEDTIFNGELGGYDLGGWAFRFNDVDWEELERDIEAAAKAVDAGMWTPDEGREATGKEPLGTEGSGGLYYQGAPLLGNGQTVAEMAAEKASALAVQKAMDVVQEVRDALLVIAKGREQTDG
jgi:hypothetical protein